MERKPNQRMKNSFGEDYPAAITVDGVRIPLQRETRFTRIFALPGNIQAEHHYSRFMDGSASITFEQLKEQWPEWTEGERSDFCQACCWLNEQSDFGDILRFIMRNGALSEQSGIALSVAGQLPQDEAFGLLVSASHAAEIGESSNFAQAISHTKHPKAEVTLREHLRCMWAQDCLWEDDNFLNWVAFDATTCIAHLLELGVQAVEFEEQVRRLSKHSCSGNRKSCKGFLAKYYPWL
jgi:hypothetical protein